MKELDLKSLSRKQLLELLLLQTQRADRLEAELEEAKRRIRDKTLIETEAGSIAEASLKLNGVFEAAQAAASQYVENVRRMNQASPWERSSDPSYSPPVWSVEERPKGAETDPESVRKRISAVSEKIEGIKDKSRELDELFEEITEKQDYGNEA